MHRLKMFSKTAQWLLSRPHYLFLAIAIPFGTLAIYAVPPLVGNDEISHISRAYEIANGTMITGKTATGNFGGSIPTVMLNLYRSNDTTDYLHIDNGKIAAAKSAAAQVSINTADTTEISYSGSALYSPVSYSIHSLTIFVCKLFNASVLSTIYAVRVVVFAVFVALSFLAIRLAPIKRWFLFAIALLPMSVLLGGNITIDGLLIGSVLLYVALLLHIYFTATPKLTIRSHAINSLWLIALLGVYIALAKPVYAPLLLLTLLPVSKLYARFSRRWFVWAGLSVLTPLVLMLSWNITTAIRDVQAGQRLSVNSINIYPPSTSQALHEFISQPTTIFKLAFHTYVDENGDHQDIPNYIVSSFFGKFTEYRLTPALWFDLSVGLTLLLGFCLKDRQSVAFGTTTRAYTLLSLAVAIVAISLSMYLYATTFHQDAINGIQGRYFIPLAPFFVFLLSKRRLLVFQDGFSGKAIITSLSILNLLAMSYLLVATFLA